VKVAPLTPLMLALSAASTSDLSMGMAWSAICWEVGSAACRAGTVTLVIRFLLTVTLTASSQYPYRSRAPVALCVPPAAPAGRLG
jgi:hypothetical protein